ncbi:unnamed protein product [Rhizophagus irregularis]|nr:unnamed protein product [Rhizophagus irregularis]
MRYVISTRGAKTEESPKFLFLMQLWSFAIRKYLTINWDLINHWVKIIFELERKLSETEETLVGKHN